MGKTELYILIAVFVLLTVILVWIGAKMMLDMHRRGQRQKQRRRDLTQI
ncbi:MAG: hypothetical protein KA067_02265 [Prevotella sp.]|nr:hypothetical protein [Prevotella sp.]